MKENKNFISGILNELKNTSKYLTEAYIFDGEEPITPGMPGEEPVPTVPQQQAQAAQQGDSAEEQAMRAQEIIKHEPIVGKIRETAIEGLRKYADNPTSELYTYFKSVFWDSDKLLTKSGGNK